MTPDANQKIREARKRVGEHFWLMNTVLGTAHRAGFISRGGWPLDL